MADPLLDLIELIYEAPLRDRSGEDAWGQVTGALARHLGAMGAILLFNDAAASASGSELLACDGFPAAAHAVYGAEYAREDYRLGKALVSPPGTVFADEWDFDYAACRRTRIFNDFYRPLGAGQAMGIRLFEGDRIAVLSSFRPLDGESWRPEELHLVRRVAPHLARALQLKRQLDRAENTMAGLRLGLDHFAIAVLLLDAAGRVTVANRAADAMLARPDVPLRLRDGRLATLHAADGPALSRHLAAAAHADRPPDPVLRLRSRDGAAVFSLMAVRAAGPFGGTLVFVNDPGVPSTLAPGLLAAQLGLSASESEVVAALCTGVAADEVARSRGVGLATVRAQIKAALAKTGLNSQAGLIALAGRSLATLIRR